ncbi:hypothetical protein [Hyphomicrobium sp. D-2]|uniref:hypothetical protein n=1 Tax=Hyphomicrobium sp. D-2 TaxID=3041621 RepID=UPI00245816BE|nr:hypothetical protein [Hyphomicrobium sp. D-2]MDH4982594.1 hypothetical protein [Hyphomicrobium sp. D-2]
MRSTAKSFGNGAACAIAFAATVIALPHLAAADDPAHSLAEKFARAADDSAKIAAQEKRAAERLAAQQKAAAERDAAQARARREKAAAAEQARVAAQRAADEAEMLRKAEAEKKQRQLAEQERAEKKRIEAERKLARDNAQRIAEEARRQRAEMDRKAEIARRAEAERLIREVEQQRIADEKRLAAAAKAAEQKKRAEEARIAEIRRQAEAAEKQRRDEEARVAELKRKAQAAEAERRAQEERLAQQQRAADAAAAKQRAALEAAREDEARRIAEKFRLAREAQEARDAQEARAVREASARPLAQPGTRPLPDMGARSSLGGPIPDALPPASPFIDAPAVKASVPAAKPGAKANTAARARPAAANTYPQRVTVLIEMDARRHGFMGEKMTANPVLCVADSCYVSNGSTMPATAMNRNKTLGPGNTLGRNASVCRNDTTCVFRGVLLPSANTTIQPVDMGMLRHDRREIRSVKPDTSCQARNGQLSCATPIVASRYRAWIVPEQVAEAAGSRALENALDAGLPAISATYGSWDTTVRTR